MKSVVVDFRISEKSIKTLKSLGYSTIKTIPENNVNKAICGHPDIIMCNLDKNHIISKPSFACVLKKFTSDEIICGKSDLKEKYPFDIAYNCAKVGNYLFCLKEYTDLKILEYCHKSNIKILNIKQGYAKCSICVVSDDAIITADENIYKIAKQNNIDVFLTSNDSVQLNGFKNGFFGGATGLLEDNLLAVNGNLKLSKDHEDIMAFCKNRQVDIISLSDENITDVGSIIRINNR